MIGFSKVLVALDGSALSEQALKPALQATADGGTLILFQVADLVADNYLPEGTDKEGLWEMQLKPHREYLARLEKNLQSPHAKVESELGTGPIDRVIVDFVEQNGVDLIVMCTHAKEHMRHLLLGSVASKVVKTSPVPVMVVRP